MEETLCPEEMEPAPRAGDPDQEKDKAVADKETRAEAPVAERAGAKVKDHKEGRAKAKDHKEGRAKAKDHKEGRTKVRAVEDDKAVNKSSGMIY